MTEKKVLIVESPTKARTLSAYLGQGYEVHSSKGHVRDLPEKELGVDVAQGFSAKWVVRDRRVVSALKKAVKDAAMVYLATDPDREGEAIAFDLWELLGDGNRDRFVRVLLHEITPQAVRAALQSPGQVDLNKVEAQRARRILDRLVGYQVSPLLSLVLAGRRFEGLSAGRVQSVALRFICDRELEIQDFQPEPYWEVEARFPTQPPFSAKLEGKLTDRREVERLREALEVARFVVEEVAEEEVKRRPPPPFITSTLQQAAASELRMSPRRTMQIAQQLYEGVEVKGERLGLITYMRTDSVRVADSAIKEARALIKDKFGKNHLSPKPRVFKNKRRAQDAHEAIRPTRVALTPEEATPYLTPEQAKLYELIWRRFLATQMADGIWQRRKVVIKAGDWTFKASASRPVFPGFTRVLPVGKLEDEGRELPGGLTPGQELPAPELAFLEKETEPPKRYTEAGLVRKLEREGIGRPSTYAQIVSVIQERGYVRRDSGALRPTLLGHVVTDFLREHFPETVREDFTAEMEEDLDRIQEGQANRLEVLSSFYSWFSERLARVEQELKGGKKPFQVLTDVPCPKCGAPMEVRVWKGGLYLSCSRYPECKTTRSLPPNVKYRYRSGKVELAEGLAEADDAPGSPCPKCGTPMQLKHGRYGRFLSCPNCGATAPVGTGVTCPKCGQGELVERYSPRRGTFWACNRYPDCRFILPGKPVETCPVCKKGVLYEDPR
ncbi:type I DNA topoisomerase, partial [Candidatus Acetothermia bacterium]